MIDTIFFLLIFFILSSLSLTNLGGISVQLPTAASSELSEQRSVIISITHDGVWALNEDVVAPSMLGARLAEYIEQKHLQVSDVQVILKADAHVEHGVVVSCIDTLKVLGVKKFSIATLHVAVPTKGVAP